MAELSLAQRTPETLPLTDLPSPWLQQLPGELDHDALLALFKTCRAMRDLALSERKVRLQFDLPILAARASGAKASLLLACNQSSIFKLILVGAGGDNPGPVAEINPSACNLMMSSAMAAAGRELIAIKRVELQDLMLDALVPSWLTFTCPHMTSLQLRACQFSQLPDPSTSIPACSQLRQLQLLCAPDITDDVLRLQWQHQLRALTGLRCLILEGAAGEDLAEPWMQCSSAIGGQLTQLSLTSDVALPAELAAWFPCVSELHLTHMWLGDGDMQVPLSMPSLKHLECVGFQLQHSYTDRPCSWTQLSVSDLDIRSFARLPLGCVQSLQAVEASRRDGGATFIIYPCVDLEAIRQAVAAINKRGGILWGAVQSVMVSNLDDGADSACLAALMPLLSTCTGSVIRFYEAALVTAELLAALKQHLTSTQLQQIEFKCCSWAPGVCALVLPSLPPQVHTLRVQLGLYHGPMTEAQLIAVCVHACRPITVHVACKADYWPSGWQQRLRDAMGEIMAQQHVTFEHSELE